MISREKYILTVLAEEAAEVAQAASKAIRFGMDSKNPYNELTNKQTLIDEVNDLMAMIWELNEKYNLEFSLNRNAQEQKRLRVERHFNALYGHKGTPSPPQPPLKGNKMDFVPPSAYTNAVSSTRAA